MPVALPLAHINPRDRARPAMVYPVPCRISYHIFDEEVFLQNLRRLLALQEETAPDTARTIRRLTLDPNDPVCDLPSHLYRCRRHHRT